MKPRRYSREQWVEWLAEQQSVFAPRQRAHTILDCFKYDFDVLASRQIKILGHVFADLFHTDVVAAPQRYPIEIHSQSHAGILNNDVNAATN